MIQGFWTGCKGISNNRITPLKVETGRSFCIIISFMKTHAARWSLLRTHRAALFLSRKFQRPRSLSLCTTTTPAVLPSLTVQKRTAPTVSVSSVTGRLRGFSGSFGFPWEWQCAQGHPFMSSRCKKILQTIRKAFNINGSGLSGRCYDAPTRFR